MSRCSCVAQPRCDQVARWQRCDATEPRRHAVTTCQCCDATEPRRHRATPPRSNNVSMWRRHRATSQPCDGDTLSHCHIATPPRSNNVSMWRRHRATSQPCDGDTLSHCHIATWWRCGTASRCCAGRNGVAKESHTRSGWYGCCDAPPRRVPGHDRGNATTEEGSAECGNQPPRAVGKERRRPRLFHAKHPPAPEAGEARPCYERLVEAPAANLSVPETGLPGVGDVLSG
jgi:hypothetical protein